MLQLERLADTDDRARVLIVDDEEAVVRTLEHALHRHGFPSSRSVTNSAGALDAFDEYQPDIVIIDIHMPGIDGLTLISQMQERADPGAFLPIIAISGDPSPELRQNALSHGAHDFVGKPFNVAEVSLRVRNLLRLRDLTHDLDERVEQRTTQLRAAEVDMANRLALVAEYRDYPDGAHVQRVGRLSAILAARVGMSDADVAVIRFAAPLHDIGKIAIPDSILLKPSPLTLEELDVMKSHTAIGARMLSGSQSPILRMGEDIARHHHENWDGTGYTPGIRGEDIPLAGRIVGVVDVFDALTHTRPYKRAWTVGDAVDWIINARGRKFDPTVVDALTDAMDEIESEAALTGANLAFEDASAEFAILP